MELFVGNLDPETTEHQLREYFKGFDKQATFKIVSLEEIDHDEGLIYGLITIESDRLAKKAIKKLNYKRFRNRLVVIREFHYRASQNDKRALNWRMVEWLNKERRGRERRKNRKVIKNAEDYEIVGNADYLRMHNWVE